jgi:hypothetical protein
MDRSDVHPGCETTGPGLPDALKAWLVTLAGSLALVAVVAWPAVSGRWNSSWIVSAVTSSLFLRCLAVVVVGAAGLSGLMVILWRSGAGQRRKPRDGQGGAAIVEFALVLPIMLMIVLVMVQSSMLMGGNLCVHYAAYCACRSAVVQIPADLSDRGGEGANRLAPPAGSLKHLRAKRAAVYALLPVACGNRSLASADDRGLTDGLADFFQSQGVETPGWVDGRIARKIGYADDYTSVEIDPPADNEQYRADEEIKVTVDHTLYLSVPYGAWLFATLDDDGAELSFGDGEYGMVIRATCFMRNEGTQDYVDVERFDTVD